MVSRPTPGMASRALITRLRSTCSIWLGSARTRPSPGSSVIDSSRSSPITRLSIGPSPPTTALRCRTCGWGGGLDEIDVAPRRALGHEAVQQELGPPEDHREQVVEVMRDPSGQAAHDLHLLGLEELRLELLPLGEIEERHERRGTAVPRGERDDALDPDAGAVPPHALELVVGGRR